MWGKTMKICKMMYLNTGPRLQRLIGNVTVIMAHGSKCHAIWMKTIVEIQELKELETIQEEADTRMLLHAAHQCELVFPHCKGERVPNNRSIKTAQPSWTGEV